MLPRVRILLAACLTSSKKPTPPIEAARRASQKNLSLSEENLQEYQRLRAHANTQAVAERQSLQVLGREEKTSARTLASIQESYSSLEDFKAKLEAEIGDVDEKKGEVSSPWL